MVVLHGEHYDPMFFSPKDRGNGLQLNTIGDFSRVLRKARFDPVVFRYALEGKRFPRLKKTLFTVAPFKFVNGWFRFASFVMLGVKAGSST